MRRALLVGIDDYPTAPLAGCVNDARAMAALIARHADNSPNFDVQLLTSDKDTITRAALRASIEKLFQHDKADVALLYFSGHGTENDLDGFLVTPDAARYEEGVGLTEVLTMANQSKTNEVVLILDSCMSGALGQLPATGSNQATLREGVAILTASRAGQVSMESGGRGVFTELVCGALDGGAADVLGHVTAASIYAYVEQALGSWDQRPLFKAHVATLTPLRKTTPAVKLETLRQLSDWFTTPNAAFPLDPSYEHTTDPQDEQHQDIFRGLQEMSRCKLVEPIGEEFMYYAAVNSKACRLTPLGQQYWRMAQAKRI
jgi:uncharacterized caspase-like protein